MTGMTNRETLRSLADACEALSGPCRETDALIWAATVGGYIEGNAIWHDDRGWVKHAVSLGDGMVRERTLLGDPRNAPAYTASIDSAMSLGPEGWHTSLVLQDRHSRRWAWELRGGCGLKGFARAATPALALTAASLRAIGEGL